MVDFKKIIDDGLIASRQSIRKELCQKDVFYPDQYRDYILNPVWKALVEHYNKTYGSNAHKGIKAIKAEAGKRGYTYERWKVNPRVWFLEKENGRICFEFGRRKDGDYLDFWFGPVSAVYYDFDLKVDLEAGPMFDCMDEMLEAVAYARKALDNTVLDILREIAVDAISLPSLRYMAEEEFMPKATKYYVGTDEDGNILNVNITSDFWISGHVSLDGFDTFLSLIPLVLNCQNKEARAICPYLSVNHDNDGRHEAAWKTYRKSLERSIY